MSNSLHAAYQSLSDSVFELLAHPDLPDPARSAIIDFSLDLRARLNSKQRRQIDAMELRASLPVYFDALSQASAKGDENERLPAKVED